MAFTPTNTNYASEYSRAMSNGYEYLSYFPEIWNSEPSTTYRPGLGKTVYIPSMTVKGSTPVDRDRIDGVFTRNHNNEWTPVELDMDREWSDLVDPMDTPETNEVVAIGNITRVFNRFQKMPEMDAYLAGKVSGFVTPDTTAITAADVLDAWDDYLAAMTNARVPLSRVHAWVTPAMYKLFKQAVGITRFIDLGREGEQGVNRRIGRLDGVGITEVPADLMKTKYTFTEGYAPAADAKQVNLIIADPMAIAAPVRYDVSMISAASAQSKGKALYYERYYYGAFAVPHMSAGIIVNADK